MVFPTIRNGIRMPNFFTISPLIHAKYREHFGLDVEMLYHYTSLDGFKGIIEGKSFWASDIRFLNDSTEFTHGRNLCLECVEALRKQTSKADVVSFIDVLQNMLTDPLFLWGDIRDSQYFIFVVSFCEDGDLLSQWRGYSGGQQGVSLGFKVRDLVRVSTQYANDYFIPNKVIYEDDVKREIINDILRIGLCSYKYNSHKWSRDIIQSDIARMVRGALYWFLPLFKHSSFKQEQEWRFQFYIFEGGKPEEKVSNVQFRVRDNFLLPYMNLKLYYQQQTEFLPLSAVRVGPSTTPDLTKQSIEFMLKSRGFSVPVEISKIPFRGW